MVTAVLVTHKLTPEACAELGMTPAALNSWLSRNERYKPKARTPNGAMLWTDAEIEQVRRARATALLRARRQQRAGVVMWRRWPRCISALYDILAILFAMCITMYIKPRF